MKVTSSEARFEGKWVIEVQVEPGSVPDRPMPYSSVGSVYRPWRLRLVFCTSAATQEDTAALRMMNLGFMKAATEAVRVYSVTIYGCRLKKDGTEGQHVADEVFFPRDVRDDGTAPEWVREICREQLRALGAAL